MAISSKKVTITVDQAVLDMVDRLTRYEFTTRSDIIRLALLEYLRAPQRIAITAPASLEIERKFEFIKDDNPYLDENDVELILFLYNQKIQGSTDK